MVDAEDLWYDLLGDRCFDNETICDVEGCDGRAECPSITDLCEGCLEMSASEARYLRQRQLDYYAGLI